MEKPLIIHIHTDLKFTENVKHFESQEFVNSIIVIGNRKSFKHRQNDLNKSFSSSRKDLCEIIQLCEKADMVILYELNLIKSYIVNRLSKKVIVVWRFFGTELYMKISDRLYSEKTLDIMNGNNYNLSARIRKISSYFYSKLKFGMHYRLEFDRAAFNRTDYFMGLSKPEYDFLKITWPNLPPFLQLNLTLQAPDSPQNKIISNKIILGNNRRPYNNHLDLINGIKNTSGINGYEFLMMFNYGLNDDYTDIVRKKANEVSQIRIIDNFLTYEKFKELFSSVDAFVMNGYRQMAMKNILIALQQNVKIYLNDKNIIYSWLKDNGIKIFTIDEFFNDLKNHNVSLSEADQKINEEQLVRFSSKFSKETFQYTILEILKKRDARIPE